MSIHPERFFVVLNTHLDHISAVARSNGIDVILKHLEELRAKHNTQAVFLTGDFNAFPSDPVLKRVQSSLTWATPSNSTVGTFTDWNVKDKADTIDYLFYSSHLKLHGIRIVTDWDQAPVLASDHRPLIATLSVTKL